MIRLLSILFIFGVCLLTGAYGVENAEKPKVGHDEAKEGSHSEKEAGHAHGEEAEEGGGNVGPEKGIVEANESKGFKLSPEALKNFDIKLQKLSGDGPWSVPRLAVVHSGEETNLFRMRSDFFKRIDFQTVKKTESSLVVDSDDLRDGDHVVVAGLGFLRISELAAFGGVEHGHSH